MRREPFAAAESIAEDNELSEVEIAAMRLRLKQLGDKGLEAVRKVLTEEKKSV